MNPDDLKIRYTSPDDLTIIRYAKIRNSLQLAAKDAVDKYTTTDPMKVARIIQGLMEATAALDKAEDIVLDDMKDRSVAS